MTLEKILTDIVKAGTREARIDVPFANGMATVRVVVAKLVKPDGTVVFDALPEDMREVGKPLQ